MTTAPNPELDALYARLRRLDPGDLLALAGAYGANDPAREAAWQAVHGIVAAGHLEGDLDRVRATVGTWAARVGSIAGQQIGSAMGDQPMTDARRAAAPAVLDAAVALLLGDRLTADDRTALLRPWESVLDGS